MSTLGLTATEPDDLRDDAWVDLFPWLDSYESDAAAHLEALVPGVADWWITDSPQITAADVSLDDLVARLGALVVRRHRTTPLSVLAPTLDASIPLAALRVDSRAETVVRRLASSGVVAALVAADVESILQVRGTSVETAELIVAGVLGAALRVAAGNGVEPEDDNPALTTLLDDLTVLSRWRRLRGRSSDALIEVAIEDDAPEVIQHTAARIAALTGTDLDLRVESNPIDEIENLVEQLDEREDIVLRHHLMARVPISMGELSTRLHVSKSRAGVIAAKVKDGFAAACDFETAAGGLLASIRTEIEPVAPLERLLELHPVLTETVPSLDVPLWLALDRLDDYFEVTGGWAAAPDVVAAKARTITMLEQFESDNGVVELGVAADTLRLDGEQTAEWLRYCEIPLCNGAALLATRRLVDHAAGILEASGRHMDTGELIDELDTNKSKASVERALADDSRIELRDGRWHLLAPKPSGKSEDRNSKVIRRTRRLYRVGASWRFRMVVTPDQLRGSGVALPAGVALAFGCRPGTVRDIASPLGGQTLRWTGTNPMCGTIRRFLVDSAIEPRETIFLTCSDEGTFGIDKYVEPISDDPVRHALALVGHPSSEDVDKDELASLLAVAAGLPADTKPRRILSAYQARDDVIAALLESAWVVSAR